MSNYIFTYHSGQNFDPEQSSFQDEVMLRMNRKQAFELLSDIVYLLRHENEQEVCWLLHGKIEEHQLSERGEWDLR